MDRLRDGYTDAKSGSGYGGWVVTKHGCWVAQKGVNRESNGYIQIAPISTATRAGTTNGVVKAKPLPQGAHRLAVIASKRYKTPSCSLNSTNLYLASSNDDVQRMLDGDHASHRCHNPRCLNPEHLIVESKERNEARKGCAGRVQVYTTIGGLKYVLEAKACSCEGPPCIITKEEHRSATLLIWIWVFWWLFDGSWDFRACEIVSLALCSTIEQLILLLQFNGHPDYTQECASPLVLKHSKALTQETGYPADSTYLNSDNRATPYRALRVF